MIDPSMIAAFSDELQKIASSVKTIKAIDAAMGHLNRVPGLTVAQRAAMATKAGKGFSTSIPGKIDRAMEARGAVFTPKHTRNVKAEWAAKAPTEDYTRRIATSNIDLVNPATGKKRGWFGRFAENWKRGEPAKLPAPAAAGVSV